MSELNNTRRKQMISIVLQQVYGDGPIQDVSRTIKALELYGNMIINECIIVGNTFEDPDAYRAYGVEITAGDAIRDHFGKI